MRLRLRPRLRFSDITNKILDSNFSSCGSNGAAAAAAAAAVAAADGIFERSKEISVGSTNYQNMKLINQCAVLVVTCNGKKSNKMLSLRN
mgnify:CR=1 FL=1